jgi:ribosome-associated translation inhibitor RaiA
MLAIVEIHNHKNHEKVKGYCEEVLDKYFGKYTVITTCRLRLSREEGLEPYEAKLEISTKLGDPVFAQETHMNEHKALDNVIKKARRQLERSKEKRYQSTSKSKRSS